MAGRIARGQRARGDVRLRGMDNCRGAPYHALIGAQAVRCGKSGCPNRTRLHLILPGSVRGLRYTNAGNWTPVIGGGLCGLDLTGPWLGCAFCG